jgi:hypothetical protein
MKFHVTGTNKKAIRSVQTVQVSSRTANPEGFRDLTLQKHARKSNDKCELQRQSPGRMYQATT